MEDIMNMIVQAIRNLLRSPFRNSLATGSIVLATIVLLTLGGYYEYTAWGLRESLIHSQYAHVQVWSPGYRNSAAAEPFGHTLSAEELIKIEKIAESIPGFSVCANRLESFGILATTNGKTSKVLIEGVEPKKESLINTFLTYQSGKIFMNSHQSEAEIGKSLAEKLHIQLGDFVTLTTVDRNNEQTAVLVKVVGITGTFSKDYDSVIVKIPLSIMQELTDVNGVQEVAILLKNTLQTQHYEEKLIKLLQTKGLRVDVTNWRDLAGYFNKVIIFNAGFFRIVMIFIVIVCFFVTFNTILLGMEERYSEWGTRRSMGETKISVSLMLFVESLFISFVGWIIGSLLVLLLKFGIDLGIVSFTIPKPPGGTIDIPGSIRLSPPVFIRAVAVSIFTPLLATILPVFRLQRMTIIDLLRKNQ